MWWWVVGGGWVCKPILVFSLSLGQAEQYGGPYVVYSKHRGSPYVVHFKCRYIDSPYTVHFKHRYCPYVMSFIPRDCLYVY